MQKTIDSAIFSSQRLRFGTLILFNILAALAGVVDIFYVGRVLQEAIDRNFSQFWINIAIMLALFLFLIVLFYLRRFIALKIREHAKVLLRQTVLNNLDNYVDAKMNINHGKLSSILRDDINQIVSKRINAWATLASAITTVIAALVIIAIEYSWALTLIVLALALLSLAVPIFFSKVMANINLAERNNANEYESSVATAQRYLLAYQFLRAIQKLRNVLVGADLTYEKQLLKLNAKSLAWSAIPSLVVTVFQIAGLAFAIYFFTNGWIAVGALATVAFFNGEISSNFQIVVGSSIPGFFASKKLFNARIKNLNCASKVNLTSLQSISLSDWNIEQNSKKLWRQNLSVDFKHGKKYLVKGPNGIGKSLLFFSLINPTIASGKLTVNGLESSNSNWWKSGQVSILAADAKIFDGSVLDNITLFERAQVDLLVVSAITQGLDLAELDLASNAQDISLGQKQRLAIARALYLNTKWVILDEALSNVDLATAQKVLAFVAKRVATLIVVSHHEIMKEHWYDQAIVLS